MIILNCGIGLLTPPVGSVLFIGSMHDSGSPAHILRSVAQPLAADRYVSAGCIMTADSRMFRIGWSFLNAST